MNAIPGKFITLEGGEGVGKSTNLALVRSILEEQGLSVVETREPGGTRLGEQLRELLLSTDNLSPVPMAELLMIFAARAQHVKTVIEPALSRGAWVLCDRFTDATYAYQGVGRGLDIEAIAILEQLVQGDRRPDLTILLDVTPEVGLARADKRGELDRFERESTAFFNRVREGYLARARARPQHWCVVNAGLSLEQVQKVVSDRLSDWLMAQHA